jgi:hypothetical protein
MIMKFVFKILTTCHCKERIDAFLQSGPVIVSRKRSAVDRKEGYHREYCKSSIGARDHGK